MGLVVDRFESMTSLVTHRNGVTRLFTHEGDVAISVVKYENGRLLVVHGKAVTRVHSSDEAISLLHDLWSRLGVTCSLPLTWNDALDYHVWKAATKRLYPKETASFESFQAIGKKVKQAA